MHKCIFVLISVLLFSCTVVAAPANKAKCFKVLGPNKVQFGEMIGIACRVNDPVLYLADLKAIIKTEPAPQPLKPNRSNKQ